MLCFTYFAHLYRGGWQNVKKKHNIYPTEKFVKPQCQLLSMFDMYRSLALLFI